MRLDIDRHPRLDVHADDHVDSCNSGFIWEGPGVRVAVLGYKLGYEGAEELLFEYLDSNAPGLLCEPDYEEAAEELGVPWPMDEATEEDQSRVWEHAECDLMICGHTTLANGSALCAWEWAVSELAADEVREARELLR